MAHSLLSSSSIKIFGQPIHDLEIKPPKSVTIDVVVAVADFVVDPAKDVKNIFKAATLKEKDQFILIAPEPRHGENGLYQVKKQGNNLVGKRQEINVDVTYLADKGRYSGYYFTPTAKFGTGDTASFYRSSERNLQQRRRTLGANKFLENQLYEEGARLARIYGFSFDGMYVDLERPTIFLVHGLGEEITSIERRSRAPRGPEYSGSGAAGHQMSSDMRVWEYDKSDFTLRLDMYGGMFEEVLLGYELGGYDDVYGGLVGGGKVGGGKVGGGKVGGGKVGGGKVGGGKIGG